MPLSNGIALFLTPRQGSPLHGSGIMIVREDGIDRLHVFHSRESARLLMERYRSCARPDVLPTSKGVIAVSALPETSKQPDTCLEGELAELIYYAFEGNTEEGFGVTSLVSNVPRLLVFFCTHDGQQALCIWKDEQEYHAVRLASLQDIEAMNEEIGGIISTRLRNHLVDVMRDAGMPAAAHVPPVRFDGAAAAMIGHVFEMHGRRKQAS